MPLTRFASDLLKRGGLSNVHDYNAHGGFGLSFGRGSTKRTYIVGNKTSVALRSKILEWDAFNEMYPDELSDEGIAALCDTVNRIIDGRISVDLPSTLEILRATYKMDDVQISQTLLRRLNFGEFTKVALQTIFENWMRCLERLVIDYSKTRNEYIKKTGAQDIANDIEALSAKWTALDKYYEINSSSPILLYSYFPNRPYDLPWLRGTYVEDDVWDIKIPEFHWTVSGIKETDEFYQALTRSGFAYLGFCPRAPKQRLMRLLAFPADALAAATKALGGSDRSNRVSLESLCARMRESQTLDADGNHPVFAPPNMKRLPEPNGTTVSLVKWYVTQFIDIYMQLKLHFESIENYYVELARKLRKIGSILEKI